MTAQVVEVVEGDGKTIWVYDSGMERDATTGQIVKPAPHTIIRTTEKASELHRRRQELARAELIAGATEAVAQLRPDLIPVAGSMAYIRAIGFATQSKAMMPKDPKQTDAARLLLTVGAQIGAQPVAPTNNNALQALGMMFVELARRSGLLTETPISVSNNLRVGEQDNDVIDASPTDQELAE